MQDCRKTLPLITLFFGGAYRQHKVQAQTHWITLHIDVHPYKLYTLYVSSSIIIHQKLLVTLLKWNKTTKEDTYS